MQLILRTLLLCVLALILLGCQGKHAHKGIPAKDIALPRANPAYIQWLRQQSMLGWVNDLIAQVSGTERIWQNSGTEQRYPLLLRHAPTWLMIDPSIAPTQTPLFSSLAQPSLLQTLKNWGIQGIFISPAWETAQIWAEPGMPTHKDAVTGFSFAKQLGDETSYAHFFKNAQAFDLQIGGSLPPAHTGIGPDFMLQTQGLPDYAGLYACVLVPQSLWKDLPPNTQGEPQPLDAKTKELLITSGVIPQYLHKNSLPFANPSGWALTGAIQGADGNLRRFVYCFDTHPSRPVLFWQDPSGLAKRLYAAATIRLTGLLRQTLAALPIKALMGLDALRQGEHPSASTSHLEPGLSALGELSQTIHRYGGWSLTTEDYPLSVLPVLLEKTDFACEYQMATALDQAIATEDTTALQALLRQIASLPNKRLVHTLPTTNEAQALSLAIQASLPGLLFLQNERLPLFATKTDQNLLALLQARKEYNLAEGTLLPPPPSPKSCLLLLNQLPNATLWLVAANFSKKQQDLSLPPLPRGGTLLEYRSLNGGKEMTKLPSQRILSLNPRAVRHILIK
ncbi:MAG: hypothetical protein IJS54_04115 [Desulfovibrio sp.]|nr:hypothetical protein [Desulfovibrio sp.]